MSLITCLKKIRRAYMYVMRSFVSKSELAYCAANSVLENPVWFENPQNGWPPNSPRTIRRKGSDQPLVDTGEMRKAITYVVRDKP